MKIAPSILSSDFSQLGDEIKRVEAAGADIIHIDIMDGHFVPNLTFGPPIVAAIRKCTKLPFDVHLMISDPEQYIDPFIAAGADIISVHVEATNHLHRLIQSIKQQGVKAAVALNPATSLVFIEEILTDVNMVLLMSVNPGFGGQKFIPSSLTKLKKLKQILVERNLEKVDIEIDGGINLDNVQSITSAGANIIVAGSAVFNHSNLQTAIDKLRG